MGRYYANPRAPLDLGIIVSFNNGSALGKNQETTPCPHSWMATYHYSSLVSSVFFSTPPMTLSMAISKSKKSTES